MLRDYVQDLEAVLLSKPNKFGVEALAMWQDYCGRALAKGASSLGGVTESSEVEDAEELPSQILIVPLPNFALTRGNICMSVYIDIAPFFTCSSKRCGLLSTKLPVST